MNRYNLCLLDQPLYVCYAKEQTPILNTPYPFLNQEKQHINHLMMHPHFTFTRDNIMDFKNELFLKGDVMMISPQSKLLYKLNNGGYTRILDNIDKIVARNSTVPNNRDANNLVQLDDSNLNITFDNSEALATLPIPTSFIEHENIQDIKMEHHILFLLVTMFDVNMQSAFERQYDNLMQYIFVLYDNLRRHDNIDSWCSLYTNCGNSEPNTLSISFNVSSVCCISFKDSLRVFCNFLSS